MTNRGYADFFLNSETYNKIHLKKKGLPRSAPTKMGEWKLKLSKEHGTLESKVEENYWKDLNLPQSSGSPHKATFNMIFTLENQN